MKQISLDSLLNISFCVSCALSFDLQRIRELEDKIDMQRRQIKEIEEKVCMDVSFSRVYQSVRSCSG